ncbi:MAG: hypothetical protein ACQERF_08355, partial [Actinomycetota bacterium]
VTVDGDETVPDTTFAISYRKPLTLAAGESATITVSFQAEKGADVGGTQAFLTVEEVGGDELAHAALYAYIR